MSNIIRCVIDHRRILVYTVSIQEYSRCVWTLNPVIVDGQNFNINTHLNFPYLEDLQITTDLKNIETIYRKSGVIQLRPLTDERQLIVGCGNEPIFCGINPCKRKYMNLSTCWWFEKFDMDTNNYFEMYSIAHRHQGVYTIDTDLGMNPSIVAEFGTDDLTFLGSELFDEIRLECLKGGRIPPSTPFLRGGSWGDSVPHLKYGAK